MNRLHYIHQQITHDHAPTKRRALSSRFPHLKPLIIETRRFITSAKNILTPSLARTRLSKDLPSVIARHQSVLLRKLGDSDMRLQLNKVQNLTTAAKALNGLVIQPGEIFSLWDAIGKPTKRRGYVNGMLLADGKVIEGMGGGLCQLANFLHWIFLHADVEIVERYHHSMDVFPDSGRVLPFGSGATILYNFVDLKIKNVGNTPLQITIAVNETHLKGQLRSSAPAPHKFHVFEKSHCFVRLHDKYYRYNEIWREKKRDGTVLSEEKICTNFAPVLYEVTSEYLAANQFEVIDLNEKKTSSRAEPAAGVAEGSRILSQIFFEGLRR